MNIITHALIGWTFGQRFCPSRRDAGLVAVAAVIPDLDAVGAPLEVLSRGTSWEVTWFSDFHHVLGHNVAAALVTVLVAAALSQHRLKTALFAALMFHVHLLGDIVGAKGPDGEQWPIPYLYPFVRTWEITWSGQWEINAWPNLVLTILLLAYMFVLTRNCGYSFLWYLSEKGDRALVETIRQRFPLRSASPAVATDGHPDTPHLP